MTDPPLKQGWKLHDPPPSENMDVWFPLTLFCAWQNLLIHCYNQYQNHRNHTFHWKDKCEKPNISCSMDVMSLDTNIQQNEGILKLCHKVFENFYNPFLHITCRKCWPEINPQRKFLPLQWKALLTKPWAQRDQFWFLCQYFHDIYWNNNSKQNVL